MRFVLLAGLTTLVFLGNGCKTIAVDVSGPTLDQKISEYNKAKTENSCEGFTALAEDKQFPLWELAQLRAEEVCLKNPIDVAAYPIWLKPVALDAALASSQKRNDFAQSVSLAIEKSKLVMTPEEKLEWALLAKEFADKTKNPELIGQAQERVYSASPRMKPKPSENEFLSVGDDCRYHRDFKKAREYYRKVIANPAAPLDEKLSAHKGIRLSYKNSRDHDQAIAANAKMIQFLDKELKQKKNDRALLKQFNDAMVLQARSLWTRSRMDEATAMIRLAEKRLTGRWPLADVYWLRARMAEEKDDRATCTVYLDKALAQITTDGEARDKMNWVRAWVERRNKNYAKSAELIDTLIKETQNDSTRYRAMFWLGKVKSELNLPTEAQAIWDKLTQDDPLGYYGLLAYHQLQRPILQVKKQPRTSLPSSVQRDIRQILRPEIADTLIRVNELDALQSFLDETAKTYKKAKDQNDEIWVRVLKYYAQAGLYLKLFENLNLISPEHRTAILQNNPELLFPRPFEAQVLEAAAAAKVEPELIYSIMRQESAFNPKARSHADAFGLMQILPEIAQGMSKKYQIPYSKNKDLYDPSVNVRVGAALIHDQLKKYRDQFILAVASYNANDQAIQGWMASRFNGDSLDFIEDIPYEETRGYVRLVMRNLIFYRLLASKTQTLDFPQWVLKLSSTN